MSIYTTVRKITAYDNERVNEFFTTASDIPSAVEKLLKFASELKTLDGSKYIVLPENSQLKHINGVRNTPEENDKYNEFVAKLDGLINSIGTGTDVFITDFNMTNKRGVAGFGGYITATNPNRFSHVLCHNKKSGTESRHYAVAEYDKFDIFFAQYANTSKSGIYAAVFNKGLNSDEFQKFGEDLVDKCTSDHELMEGEIPTGDLFLELNDSDRVKGIEEENEAKAKKELAKLKVEKEKEEKRKEKAEADVKKVTKKQAEDVELS